MTEEMFYSILDQLLVFKDSLEDGKICLYLMQEPFLDKRIFNFIDRTKQLFPNTRIELSTNCSVLTADKADELIKLLSEHPHEIWISHHGVDKATFEYTMKINYERSLRNLIYLIKASKGRLKLRVRGGEPREKGIQPALFKTEDYYDYFSETEKNTISTIPTLILLLSLITIEQGRSFAMNLMLVLTMLETFAK